MPWKICGNLAETGWFVADLWPLDEWMGLRLRSDATMDSFWPAFEWFTAVTVMVK